jgi:phage portal protein BeeE
MAILDFVAQAANKVAQFAMRQKESRSWPSILSLGYAGPLWMPANYNAFAREGYLQNPDVYACVRQYTNGFTGFPWRLYQNTGPGSDPKVITTGPYYDLLQHPNARQSLAQLASDWIGFLLVSGNSYLEGVGQIDPTKPEPRLVSRINEINALRSDRMFVIPGDARMPIAGYEYRAGGVYVPYPAQLFRDPTLKAIRPRQSVLHTKLWNPIDDWYGLSPIQIASRNIDSGNAAIAWNVTLLQNFTRPSGVFTTEAQLSKEQIDDYTDIIRQKFSSVSGAGRPMVLGAGYEWQQMGLNPVDMDWLQGIELNTKKICNVFGVPLELLSEAATYANWEQARKAFYMESLLPMADLFCAELNYWLSPLFGEDQYVGYDRNEIEAIQADRQITWQIAQAATFLTNDEKRKMVGLQPLKPGDTLFVPNTMVPYVVPAKGKAPQLAAPPNRIAAPDDEDDEKPPKKPAKQLNGIHALTAAEQIRQAREKMELIQ